MFPQNQPVINCIASDMDTIHPVSQRSVSKSRLTGSTNTPSALRLPKVMTSVAKVEARTTQPQPPSSYCWPDDSLPARKMGKNSQILIKQSWHLVGWWFAT